MILRAFKKSGGSGPTANVATPAAFGDRPADRERLDWALFQNGGVVLYHNHPSGDPSPSKEDINYTKKMNRSLRLIDIQLVDHIIAGAHGFTTLKGKF